MITKQYITYEDMMHKHLGNIFRQMAIDEFKPEVVIGITRGGLVPAVHASHYFDVPLRTVHISLRDHPHSESLAEVQKLVNAGKRVLFVDEICDEGETLRLISDELIRNFRETQEGVEQPQLCVKYAVLVHNLGGRRFEPDYVGEEINKTEKPVWVVYPWEY
jgi:hypoxanthine phosphoribosyltransferase